MPPGKPHGWWYRSPPPLLGRAWIIVLVPSVRSHTPSKLGAGGVVTFTPSACALARVSLELAHVLCCSMHDG